MQLEFYLAGEITQVIDSIPWVRCASGNVYTWFQLKIIFYWPFDFDGNDDKNYQKGQRRPKRQTCSEGGLSLGYTPIIMFIAAPAAQYLPWSLTRPTDLLDQTKSSNFRMLTQFQN